MGIVVRSYLKDSHIVVCKQCKTHLTTPENLISRDFQGQHGRATLYAAVVNVDEGSEELKNMTTGEHVVKDVFCRMCGQKLGWKYVKCFESSQRYKVDRVILERALVTDVENPLADPHAPITDRRRMFTGHAVTNNIRGESQSDSSSRSMED